MAAAWMKGRMSQFYIGDDDETSVQRCKYSQLDGTPVTVTGLSAQGEVKEYAGIVQSLVRDGKRDPDRRWQVTMFGA
jgi:hypothetical protein